MGKGSFAVKFSFQARTHGINTMRIVGHLCRTYVAVIDYVSFKLLLISDGLIQILRKI